MFVVSVRLLSSALRPVTLPVSNKRTTILTWNLQVNEYIIFFRKTIHMYQLNIQQAYANISLCEMSYYKTIYCWVGPSS